MARRVTQRPENDHAAVAEHVLVPGQRLDFPFFIDPALETRGIGALHRRRRRDLLPVALADEQRRVRERRELPGRSEEHTSELQSRSDLVCRLLLEKKKST